MPLEETPANPDFDPGALDPTAGERQGLDHLFSLAYEELRRLAYSVRRGDPSATLNPTALVNEAWLKMAKSQGAEPASLLHFKRIAARAMRQLLIDAARRRNSQKRDAALDLDIPILDVPSEEKSLTGEDLLALNQALEELAHVNQRQALMIEVRFFGGLDVPETAALLEVSEATVLRDWRAARAWLAHELRRTGL